jgi:hypothetical protein
MANPELCLESNRCNLSVLASKLAHLSRLAETLREQQALLVLLLERAVPAAPGERVFSPTHVRRAAYAHLSVLRDVVAPALGNRFGMEHLVGASATLTERLAQVLLAPDDAHDLYARLLPSLTALFKAEQSLLATATLTLAEAQLDQLALDAEEMFESLYGRGELASERGLSRLGEL